MIKVAERIEDYKRCLDFLKEFNYYPLKYSLLFYVEKDNEIIAVAGYHRDYGSMIEPLYSKSIRASKELYEYMEDFLRKLGHIIVRQKTEEGKVAKALIKHKGYKLQNSNYLIKEL